MKLDLVQLLEMAPIESAVLFCVLLSVPAAVRSDLCRSAGAEILDNYRSGQSYDSFEAKVHESLESTKNLLAAEDSSRKADSNATSVELEPILKNVRAVFPILQEGLDVKSEWEKSYAKAILGNLSESRRSEVEGLIPQIEGKLDSIQAKTKQLNETQPLEEQRTKVKALDSELNELVGIFKQDRVILRDYPLLANKAVLSLGLYVPVFRLYEKSVDNALFNSSELPCNLQEVLRQYGYLTTRSRLENLDKSAQPSNDLFKFSVWDVCFSEPSPRSVCNERYGPCEVEMTNIIQDHSKVYQDVGELVKKTCIHHSYPSGFGWLVVEVGKLLGDFNSSNPTVKITMDGVKQFEMARAEGGLKENDMVLKTEKISNSSCIVAEVWASEKQVFSVPLEITNKYYSSKKDGNEFLCSTFWIPENIYHHQQHHHHHH